MKLRNSIKLFFIAYLFILINIVSSTCLNAQFSPGKLSQVHSHLEGNTNCIKCHELGNKIPKEKCLNCHTELKDRIEASKGFHSSSQVKQKSCIECHSDHNGIKFNLIRWDEKKFDHSLTGYNLQGSHVKIECRKCHNTDHIQNENLKKKLNTYLGLNNKCISCHEDVHLNTLSSECVNCHQENQFKPATKFNHQKTNFPLKAAHQNVSCILCHAIETKNGKPFQKFADVKFANCNSCHKDEHKGKFGVNCKACHNEESFKKIQGSSSFNHLITGYKLEGKHKVIDCKKCHDQRGNPNKQFAEFSNVIHIDCIDCHKDVHEEKFGRDCKTCHNQESFTNNKNLLKFDHGLTAFALTGKHQKVECKSCHKGKLTDPLEFGRCNNCHLDYHNGEFNNTDKKDCKDCHSTFGFTESSFGIEQHNLSKFILVGAHLAVSCDACHFKEKKWQFKNIGLTCSNCHNDVHEGTTSISNYKGEKCINCHNENQWNIIKFDHKQTKFVLTFKHELASCKDCHMQSNNNSNKNLLFKNVNGNCNNCHQNIHNQQFNIDGKTDCNRCHSSKNWVPEKFSHDSTRFPLNGVHKVVSCTKCHIPEIKNGERFVLYRNGKLSCKDCHL